MTVTPGGDEPDSVTVSGPDGRRADAGITRQGGSTYVYPAAAKPYIAAGLVDKDLFNITLLMAQGFDDTQADGLPLIVSYGSTARRKAAARTLLRGVQDVQQLSSIDSVALTEDRTASPTFWSALVTPAASTQQRKASDTRAPALAGGAQKVWLDEKVHADLADSTAQIGAPQVWEKGDTGAGVDVAVLDSGYDPGHPDLSSVVKSSAVFVPDEDITDHLGHGTHVASTIAGSGAASGGKERGVAPGVDLHVGKVLDNTGSGLSSWVISGMEWAARDVKARVISMSLSNQSPSDGTDPMSQAVDELSEETGALFTIAAGNAGPDGSSVEAPGAATQALTVGAVASDDSVADFSSRGPRLRDDAPKPEITAPGVDILAARSQYASFGSGYYATLSGTSMATPHVAGAAALVAASHPDWTGGQIKDALVSTAAQTPNQAADDGGNGRVDTVAATEGTLFATGVVDAGIHSGGGTVDRTVTWTNTADQPAEVSLAVAAGATPDGAFTIADPHLTIPARGTASTTVATHLDDLPADQHLTAQLVAAEGEETVTRTLLSVSTREEYHHLKVHVLGQDGTPVSVLVSYQGKNGALNSAFSDSTGTLDAIVRPGTYTVWTTVAVRGTHGASSAGFAVLSAPTVEVGKDSDAEVILNASGVRRISLKTPKPSTDAVLRLDYSRSWSDGSPPAGESLMVGTGFDSLWALPTAKPASGDVLLTARWRMEQPLVAMTSGTQNFDDLWVQPGSALQPTRDRTLLAVFAGNGLTEDYAGVDARGKIAVVRYQPEDDSDDDDDEEDGKDTTASVPDQVEAAENAGVSLLVLVNDVNGRLYEPVEKTSITVVGVTSTEGESLISRLQASKSGSLPMHLVTHATTEYLYDLVHTWRGGIPANLSYEPTERQLGRVEVNFRNDPAKEVDEYRYDIQPYLGVKLGSTDLQHVGVHRTDWVTADPHVPWMEEATAGFDTLQFSDLVCYPAGSTTRVEWFGPFDRPRINRSQDLPQRTGDTIDVTVPGWGDGTENHVGTSGPGDLSQEISLYRGADLLAQSPGGHLQADVAGSRQAYRLVTTTARTGYPHSTRTSTQWTFASASPGADRTVQLPLLQVDYGIPTTADGTARRDAFLQVKPSHIPGVAAGSVRTDSVELSYDDGRTWHSASLSRSQADATTRLHAPANATFLTIRVRASDSRGDSVTQTIVRAVSIG
ncbi:S8 family serine peptidase [Streptomyces sp. NPDC090080]|uniref:S8 family serine peptidase n=1 Tax=Streptomyces sp. NPDC090080 TaxID=3365939 RepID=UPI00381A84DB